MKLVSGFVKIFFGLVVLSWEIIKVVIIIIVNFLINFIVGRKKYNGLIWFFIRNYDMIYNLLNSGNLEYLMESSIYM